MPAALIIGCLRYVIIVGRSLALEYLKHAHLLQAAIYLQSQVEAIRLGHHHNKKLYHCLRMPHTNTGRIRLIELGEYSDLKLEQLQMVNGYTACDMGGGAVGMVLELGSTHVTAESVRFHNNTAAAGPGGAISNFDQLTLTHCVFESNRAIVREGGAVFADFSADITNCTFIGNSALQSQGGAVSLAYGAVRDSTLTGNKAASGTC
jgi:hypothetical protein